MTRVDAAIARLHGLYPRLIDLSLDRLQTLLTRLGNPERRLPPVVHVAGTNGKGSTCAFLRACAEAAGWRVHVYSSPHLVQFRERFRIGGVLVSDDVLSDTLEEIEAANAGAPLTVFEAITAAGFLLFSRNPADLCVLEVGLGGRFDATNVIPPPAACAITSISLDHADFLGTDLSRIAWEKAGIIKPGAPVATGLQSAAVGEVIAQEAASVGATLLARGRDWQVMPGSTGWRFEDARGTIDLPFPSLPGAHQIDNAGIAIAALRAAFALPHGAFAGIAHAEWPARMQRLRGQLAALLPSDWELWLDGGHNPGAAIVLADHLAGWRDRPVHLIVGMKQSKDTAEFLRPLLPLADTVWAVAEPEQHLALPVADIIAASGGVARDGGTVAAALRKLPHAPAARVLVCGSLYLAGEVLKADAA